MACSYDLTAIHSSKMLKKTSNPLGYVEDFDEPRTTRGSERVSARQGWAGEESGFSASC